MRRETKTASQLRHEIAYFQRQLTSTRSADRIRRAEAAIRKRERLLAAARALVCEQEST